MDMLDDHATIVTYLGESAHRHCMPSLPAYFSVLWLFGETRVSPRLNLVFFFYIDEWRWRDSGLWWAVVVGVVGFVSLVAGAPRRE